MSIIHFLLIIYFAAVLGIAGIAKIDSPTLFISELQYQYKLPSWSVRPVGKLFPWIELVVTIFFIGIAGLNKFFAGFLILAIFIFFSVLNKIKYNQKQNASDCGCYGRTLQKRGLSTNTTTLHIQVVLAILLVVITLLTNPLPEEYYFSCMILFIVGYSWLLWKTLQRHHASLNFNEQEISL
jgi:hypothetical protein